MKNIPGKIWALPTTLVFGITAGLLGICLAPRKIRIRIAHNAICFYNYPLLRGGYAALTLGHVILFQKDSDIFMGSDISQHEIQHTIQAEVLGFLYVPLHIIFIIIHGKNVMQNPLERGPYSHPPRPF